MTPETARRKMSRVWKIPTWQNVVGKYCYIQLNTLTFLKFLSFLFKKKKKNGFSVLFHMFYWYYVGNSKGMRAFKFTDIYKNKHKWSSVLSISFSLTLAISLPYSRLFSYYTTFKLCIVWFIHYFNIFQAIMWCISYLKNLKWQENMKTTVDWRLDGYRQDNEARLSVSV